MGVTQTPSLTFGRLLFRFYGFEHHGRHAADELHGSRLTQTLAFAVPSRALQEEAFHVHAVNLRLRTEMALKLISNAMRRCVHDFRVSEIKHHHPLLPPKQP